MNGTSELQQIRRRSDCYQDVKICNCAGCGSELIGATDRNPPYHASFFGHHIAFGRIADPDSGLDRPYCEKCYRQRQRAGNGY
jgi:hypothetical protein